MVQPRANVTDSGIPQLTVITSIKYFSSAKPVRSHNPVQRPKPICRVTVVESHVKCSVLCIHTLKRTLQSFLLFERHDLFPLIQGVLGFVSNGETQPGATRSGRSEKMSSPDLMSCLAKTPCPMSGVVLTS